MESRYNDYRLGRWFADKIRGVHPVVLFDPPAYSRPVFASCQIDRDLGHVIHRGAGLLERSSYLVQSDVGLLAYVMRGNMEGLESLAATPRHKEQIAHYDCSTEVHPHRIPRGIRLLLRDDPHLPYAGLTARPMLFRSNGTELLVAGSSGHGHQSDRPLILHTQPAHLETRATRRPAAAHVTPPRGSELEIRNLAKQD